MSNLDTKNGASKKQLGQYKFNTKLGSGAFGNIYKGTDSKTGAPVAIKVETDKQGSTGQLKWEYQIYRQIGGTPIPQTKVCWPRAHAFGKDTKGNHVMVMDLLGPSLDEVLKTYGGKLPAGVVAYIADRCINLVRMFHNSGYIHRDLKPQNFVLQHTPSKYPEILLIDYGLAKEYINKERNEHAPYINGRSMKGTVRYTSIGTHLGVDQSRRDDLQSLGYILIYLIKGQLPWQNLPRLADKKEDYAHILRHKMDTSFEQLVEGVSPPAMQKALLEYLLLTNSLIYYETPDYDRLRSLFTPFKYNFTGIRTI